MGAYRLELLAPFGMPPIRTPGIAVSIEATVMKTDGDNTALARRARAFPDTIGQGQKAE